MLTKQSLRSARGVLKLTRAASFRLAAARICAFPVPPFIPRKLSTGAFGPVVLDTAVWIACENTRALGMSSFATPAASFPRRNPLGLGVLRSFIPASESLIATPTMCPGSASTAAAATPTNSSGRVCAASSRACSC